jgi:hypothetical protein
MIKWQTGYEFPPLEYCITRDIVNKYEAAVEASIRSLHYIPPLAIAAYGMKILSESEDFPPGVIHASQEFQFVRPAAIGSNLCCKAKVLQNISRNSVIILAVEINIFDEAENPVISGKATAFLPIQDKG